MPTLEQQIAQAWGAFGEWNAGGVDRVAELAAMLRAAGVGSITPIEVRPVSLVRITPGHWEGSGDGGQDWWVEETREHYNDIQWRTGGRWLGFLGNSNNDGSISFRSAQSAQPNAQVAWSARGHGNVSYYLGADTAGRIYIAPVWASSSDADTARTVGLMVAAVVAIAATGGAAAGAVGTVETGATVATVGEAATLGELTVTAGEYGVLTGAAAEGASLGLVGVEGTLTAAGGGGWLSAAGTAALDMLENVAGSVLKNQGGKLVTTAIVGALGPDGEPLPESLGTPTATAPPAGPGWLLVAAAVLAMVV